MSYEGGATPSDMMQDSMPKAGNAWFWAKVLSAHGGGGMTPSQGTVPGSDGKRNPHHEPNGKLTVSGVYVSKHLSFDPVRKAAWGNAMVANRTREIRLSGMKRGAWGNVAYGGNVNPPHNRKGGSGNPPPKGRRASALSRLQVWFI